MKNYSIPASVQSVAEKILHSEESNEPKFVMNGPAGTGKSYSMRTNYPYTVITIPLESRLLAAGAVYVDKTDESTYEVEFENCSALIEKTEFEYLVTAFDDQTSKTYAVDGEEALVKLCKKLGGTYMFSNFVGCIKPGMSFLEHMQFLSDMETA